MQKTFWSVDDNIKSSVIREKDNTTKFEILLTFDPSREIIRYIKYHVNPETDKIRIKISGDGSKVSRISNFVVLSFSLITDDLILSSTQPSSFAVGLDMGVSG
jgi:hypothetical protein